VWPAWALWALASATMKRVMLSFRLTASVEHIAEQLTVIHTDMRDANRETFTRLNSVEQRVSVSWKHNRASSHGVPFLTLHFWIVLAAVSETDRPVFR
jgi:hypothetical protein